MIRNEKILIEKSIIEKIKDLHEEIELLAVEHKYRPAIKSIVRFPRIKAISTKVTLDEEFLDKKA